MIYTVTFNPSLDYVMFVPCLQVGEVSRAARESLYPGGKGINVAVVMEQLGFRCTTLGFAAGYTGQAMLSMIQGHISCVDFIELAQGQSRINVKIKSKEESDVNGCGPKVSAQDLERLYQRLERLEQGDVLVLAGAVSAGLSADTYEQMLARLEKKGVLCVVDATGELLKKSLKHKPFLIKPNVQELADLFGVSLSAQKDLVTYAQKAQALGARNVLVSRGAEGALLLSEDGQVHTCAAAKLTGPVVNSVGAGDSMVAGFLAGWLRCQDYEKAMTLALACGGACVMQEWLPRRENIKDLLENPQDYAL